MLKYIVLLFISYPAISQNILIKGTIKDASTDLGIPYVHIYAGNNHLNGTTSNADGDFAINLTSSDKLIFSHVNYKQFTWTVDRLTSKNLIVKMEQRVINLNEVAVSTKGLTGEEIIDTAISRLKDNHKVEPIFYDFHSTLVQFDKADSVVHIIEEYHGTVYHGLLSNSKYFIKKSRIGAFSKVGHQKINEHRVIGADKMKIDNMFKYQDDYLHKRKHKKYTYTLVARATINERMCFAVKFYTDEKTYYKTGILYIDMDDYAIVRNILQGTDGTLYNRIDFVKNEVDKKWYLSSAMDYHRRYQDPSADYRQTIYFQSNKKHVMNNFNMWSSRDFVVDFSTHFKGGFWGNNTFIPLPNWVRKQIKN